MDTVIFYLQHILHSEGAQTATSADNEYQLSAVRMTDTQSREFHVDPLQTNDARDPQDWDSLLPEFLSFIDGASLMIAHDAAQMDLLESLCDASGYILPGTNKTLELQTLCKILYPQEDVQQLENAVQALDITVANLDVHQPSGIVAAMQTVLESCVKKAQSMPYVTLQQLTRLGSLHSEAMAVWFQEMSDERFRINGTAMPDNCDQISQLAFTKVQTNDSDMTTDGSPSPDSADLQDIVKQSKRLLAKDSPLHQLLPGFQVREGQMHMVESVAEALDGDMHLLAEAGTGTGKSLAYLIPSALYALEHDARVVVSTHTISLQDQIAKRDFPLLRRIIGKPVSLAVFKGRTHYVCMRKLLQEVRSLGIGAQRTEVESYMQLLVWLTETPEGNREELQFSGRMSEIWPRIQSETETCLNKRCPFFKACYYFRARAKANDADVVVTNHSLVFSDVKANHRVLPKYDKLILDEAHHLEEEATKHLGDEVHLWQCLSLIGRLARDNGKHGVIPELLAKLHGAEVYSIKAIPALEQMVDALRELRIAVEAAFTTVSEWVPPGETDVRLSPQIEGTNAWRRYIDVVDTLGVLMKDLESQSASIADVAEMETDEDLAGRLFDATGFLMELFSHVSLLCSATSLSDEWVVWVEIGNQADRRQVSLHRAPVDVANMLRRTLFDTKSSVVLTSATLSVNGSFEYPKHRLGLRDADQDGRLHAITVASPFRYDKQALLCVPTDVPELAKMGAQEAAVWLSDSLYQYAKISGGRLLALFTSHAMLRATAEQLRLPLQSLGLELFVQGVDGSRSYLLEAFRKRPQSVLLGAQSFWEGIDLPGDQLTTLVIIRLPFAPPTHPVTQARHERLSAEGLSPFTYDSLPEAVVRFRQGFGRLIRTVTDTGVVVVMDKRIVTSRYGSTFIKSVPGVNKCIGPEEQVLAQMARFLGKTNM